MVEPLRFSERAFPSGLFVAPRRRGRMEGGMRAGLHSPLKRRGGSDCKTKRNFSRLCFSPVNSDRNMGRKNAGPAFFKKQDRRSQDSIGSRFRKKGRHRPVFSPRVPPRWAFLFRPGAVRGFVRTGRRVGRKADQASMLAYLAFFSMNSRRGGTSSPMSMENI